MSKTESPREDEACAPDYSVDIRAGELIADLAEEAASHDEEYAYHAECNREDDWWQYQQWMLEEKAAMRAYATAIAMLQPESHGATVPRGEFVEDGLVKVREFMREISRLGDEAHDRDSVQADSAESVYACVTSLLRNEYGIGWPRLDDLGGNPLEEDLP